MVDDAPTVEFGPGTFLNESIRPLIQGERPRHTCSGGDEIEAEGGKGTRAIASGRPEGNKRDRPDLF